MGKNFGKNIYPLGKNQEISPYGYDSTVSVKGIQDKTIFYN